MKDNYYSSISTIVFDFSRVILFPTNHDYRGGLNSLHHKLLSGVLNYRFLDYFYLNKELLTYLGALRNKRLVIFTSGIIQNAPAIQADLRGIFESIYSAEKLKVNKIEPKAYTVLCHKLKAVPSEI